MTKKSETTHDKFLKLIMFNPDTAAIYFEDHFPKKWSSRMVLERPEIIIGDFINEELAEQQSDVLYKIKLTNGKLGLVYVLADHKNSPNKIILQLQQHLNKIKDKLSEENNWKPFPEIWPVVIYNGNHPWNASTDFARQIDVDADNPAPNVLDFTYFLIDLSQVPDDTPLEERNRNGLLTIIKHMQDILVESRK